MKLNKLLLGILATSLTLNIITLLFDSNSEQIKPNSDTTAELTSDAENSLFSEHGNELDTLIINKPDGDQVLLYKKKIAVLAKQNNAFQAQIDAANQKQLEIITALSIIADKIDSQFLMPAPSSVDFQPSGYNMDFNTISKDVVKKCMDVTSVASASVRQKQKQSRAQLLKDEAVDNVWSNEIESQIQSMLSDQQLHNSELLSLNCRTTICQITVQHHSRAAQKLFEVPFFSSFQQNVSQYDETIDNTTNQPIGIFYLTRNKEY